MAPLKGLARNLKSFFLEMVYLDSVRVLEHFCFDILILYNTKTKTNKNNRDYTSVLGWKSQMSFAVKLKTFVFTWIGIWLQLELSQ